MKLKYVSCAFMWCMLVSSIAMGSQNSRPEVNPYDPRKAFDQIELYKQHPNGLEDSIRVDLLESVGNPHIDEYNSYRYNQTLCCVLTCGINYCLPMDCFRAWTICSCHRSNYISRGSVAGYEMMDRGTTDVDSDESASLVISYTFNPGEKEKLDKALLDNFFKIKYQATMQTIYQDMLGLGCFAMLLGGVPSVIPIGAMGQSFANLILLYQGSDVLNNARRVVTANLTARNDPLLPYEISYVLLKRYLPRKLQSKIETQFSIALANTMNLEGPSLFFDKALALPRDKIAIRKTHREIAQFVSAHMSDYPKMLENEKRPIKEFLQPLFVYKESSGLPRKFLYLQSVAGTGKTTFCSKLADFLDIPIVTVKMSSTIENFVGSKDEPGTLLDAITSPEAKGVKNALLLIDEAENLFDQPGKVGLAKTIFDPNNPSFESKFLGITIPLTDYLIVFCANAPIPSQNDPEGAMKSRTISVDLGDLSEQSKSRVLEEDKYPVLKLKEFSDIDLTAEEQAEFRRQNPLTQNMRTLEDQLQSFLREKRGDFSGI